LTNSKYLHTFKELLVASPIWIMGILKAKELNKSPVASARELKASSGTSHGTLKPLNMLLKKVSRIYEIKIAFILMYVPCILYSLLS